MSAATVVALVIALGTLGVTYWLGVRRFDHERTLADVEDARSVLAKGAQELWHMKNTMRDQLTAFAKPLGTGKAWPADFGQRIGALEVRRDAVEAELDVLRIRFAEQRAVVVAYTGAFEEVKGLISVYIIAHGGQADRESYFEATKRSEAFDRCRNEYLKAAQKAVGVDLSDG